jgi:hypothetical protein
MAGAVVAAGTPNETLDHALDLGTLAGDPGVRVQGALGDGPAKATDVEWFRFTLDRAAQVGATLGRQPGSPTFRGALSLYNSDPFQSTDPYNPTGYRLLDQAIAGAEVGVAELDPLLGPGTYYLAVSGAGNLDFHPLLAGSGLPGSTGASPCNSAPPTPAPDRATARPS